MAAGAPTGFHARTRGAGAVFTEHAGRAVPHRFSDDVLGEYRACREGTGALDLSCQYPIAVSGRAAGALLQAAATRDVARLRPGRVCLTAVCDDEGLLVDLGTLFCFSPERYWFVGDAARTRGWLEAVAGRLGLGAVSLLPLEEEVHTLSVQGPGARGAVVGALAPGPARREVAALAWFSHTTCPCPERERGPLVVSRTGYSGELGYELWCSPGVAPGLWDALGVGRPGGPAPVGLAALDLLRVEAGLAFPGVDYDAGCDPFEAGFGWVVEEAKPCWFVGREALARRRQGGRRLVGLEPWDGAATVPGDQVVGGEAVVGVVTSVASSPFLGRVVALGRVDRAWGAVGTEVGIVGPGGGWRSTARVGPRRRYDPERRRVRG